MTIAGIAHDHGATPAQVIVAWMVRRKVIPLPRSGNVEHMRLNVEVLREPLSEGECTRIDALNKGQHLLKEATPRSFNRHLNKLSSHF